MEKQGRKGGREGGREEGREGKRDQKHESSICLMAAVTSHGNNHITS